MRKVSIALPDGLYLELQQAAAAMQEPGYIATHFATDVLASELASRRLPKVAQGRYGARVIETKPAEPVTHRILWNDISEQGAANVYPA
jgi:hypothetical protein